MKRLALYIIAAACTMQMLAARPKVGLVLGGGGAKGAAEVGVLKVLERAGVRPDYIVGTSIGSIVGGLYAAGYTAAELDTMMQTQEWISLLTDRKTSLSGEPYKVKDGVTYIFGFPVMDKNGTGIGMMNGRRIEEVIDSMVSVRGCTRFDELRIPFRCVAADFRSAREVVLSEGVLARALRASMAIPGIFKPVNMGGWQLVDGGMMNNLPVDVCRAMGADIVIAVDLQQEEKKPRKQNGDLGLLTSLGDLLGIGGLLEWVATRPDIQKYLDNRKQADIYIHPDLPDMDATSFGNKNCARMIAIGERAAMQQYEKIRGVKK